MENVFLTSLTTPEVRQLFRQELETYFENHTLNSASKSQNEQPINTKELINFLDITEPTLIRWRKKGKIPFLQVGSRILYQKSAVLAALENKKGAATK
jgi:excisionase family DNA binding protein